MQRTIVEFNCRVAVATFKILFSFSDPSQAMKRRERRQSVQGNALSFTDPHCYNFSGDVTVKLEKNNSVRRVGATKAKREIG